MATSSRATRNRRSANNGAEAPAEASTAPTTGNGDKQRVHIKLPSSVESSADVEWPGSDRGGQPRNPELRAEVAEHLASMTLGSTRSYAVGKDEDGSDRSQESFINLFRSVCDEVHDKAYGVLAVKQDEQVIVKLGNRRKVTNNKSS